VVFVFGRGTVEDGVGEFAGFCKFLLKIFLEEFSLKKLLLKIFLREFFLKNCF
jgi:hypothetical protein